MAFSGYDEDRRELYEIEKVRDFVHDLDEDFPYWLCFMDLSYPGLYAIGMCFVLPFLTDEAKAEDHPKQLAELFEKRWVPALNALGAKTGIADAEIDLVTSRCVDYFLKGRQKPPTVN